MSSSKNTHDKDEENQENSEKSGPKTREMGIEGKSSEKSGKVTKDMDNVPAQKKVNVKDSIFCAPIPDKEVQNYSEQNEDNREIAEKPNPTSKKEEEKKEELDDESEKPKTISSNINENSQSLKIVPEKSQENQNEAKNVDPIEKPSDKNGNDIGNTPIQSAASKNLDPNKPKENQPIPKTVDAYLNKEEEKREPTVSLDRNENPQSLELKPEKSQENQNEAKNVKDSEKSSEKIINDPEITTVRKAVSKNPDPKKSNERQQIPNQTKETVNQSYPTPMKDQKIDSSSFDQKVGTGESSSLDHTGDNYQNTNSSLKSSDERSKKEEEKIKESKKDLRKFQNPDNFQKNKAQNPEKSMYCDNEKNIFYSDAEPIKFLPKIIRTLRKNPVLIQGDLQYFHSINSRLQKVYRDHEDQISLKLIDFETKLKNLKNLKNGVNEIPKVYPKIRNIRQVIVNLF